jgi:hypothetical protein
MLRAPGFVMIATVNPTMEKKNQKSRNGCLTCKKKRLKCDESKPACQNCIKKGIDCGGYSTTFKWKSFEETSASQKVKRPPPKVKKQGDMKRSMSLPDNNMLEEAMQQASLSIAGKSSDELARQTELMKQGKNPFTKRTLTQVAEEPNFTHSPGSSPVEFTTSSIRYNQQHQHSPSATAVGPLQFNLPSPFAVASPGSTIKKRRMSSTVAESPAPGPSPGPSMGAPSPTLSTIVRSFTDFDNMNIPSPSGFDSLYPKLYEVPEEVIEEGSSSDQKQMKRSLSVDSALTQTTIPEYRKELLSYSKSLSPKSPTPLQMPQLDISKFNIGTDFDKVWQAFDKYTCSIMSIKDGPTENPWRTLMWPLAMQHSVLFKSLASMALFHVARGDDSLRKAGISYMRQSMSELAEGLVSNSIPNDVALATCLTLAITDTWDKHTTAGIPHLKGAKSIINKLDRATIQKNFKLYTFLIHSFLYYDVLSRMSSSQLLDSDYDENGSLIKNLDKLKPSELPDESNFNPMSSLFDESILKENEAFIDPLLGCACGLFLIIGRVASFIAKVRNMRKLSLSIVSKAVSLKSEIESWRPDANVKRTILEDPLCDWSSCIATAEAYRFSTLLYLEQAVPEISSQSSADLGEKVLMLLASIPTTSRTCILHMFPLLVASCEVSDPDDRAWVEDRWKLLAQKMWLGTIDRAVEIVHEVWRRKDSLKSESSVEVKGWDLFQGRIDVLSGSKKRETEGINSWTHWSSVMKDWDWEVLFG